MVTTAVRTLTREPDLAVGIVACLQTHGSLANWHLHLHLLVTDGGFRPDGTFIPWPAHDTAALTDGEEWLLANQESLSLRTRAWVAQQEEDLPF